MFYILCNRVIAQKIDRYESLGAMIVATVWPRWKWWLGKFRVDPDRSQVDLAGLMPPQRRRRSFTRGRSSPRGCDSRGSTASRTKRTSTFSWHMAWQWRNAAIPNYRYPPRRPLSPERSLILFRMREKASGIRQRRAIWETEKRKRVKIMITEMRDYAGRSWRLRLG